MNMSAKLSIVLLSIFPLLASAEDWYVGNSFIYSGDSAACVIVRFKASDGSYTLAQADALYSTIASLVVNQDLGDTSSDTTLPSQNHANNVTGEQLASYFVSEGTGVCTVGGQPVDAVGFVSTFRCEYQNENQMCIRLYVDTGELDLSALGIPQGPATVGGIFIKREVWDAVFALMLSNSNTLDATISSPFSPDAGVSRVLAPLKDSLQLILPMHE